MSGFNVKDCAETFGTPEPDTHLPKKHGLTKTLKMHANLISTAEHLISQMAVERGKNVQALEKLQHLLRDQKEVSADFDRMNASLNTLKKISVLYSALVLGIFFLFRRTQ